ncbi:hypothetical protein [Sphingosinicella sp. BN140058]|uniref:hypothetical protein n=1 Tax=Sphingosinicella sp. BN140058 TaxID=1892855 RepID=UPI001011E806|nr:hypothetical protein [Sphingosinicella sp. BN140058]QAY76506.1 hypothetical protein ETR14_08370 [Sphingosinicella sp. BN140058]
MKGSIAAFAACLLLLPGCSQAGAPTAGNDTERVQAAPARAPSSQEPAAQAATARAAPATPAEAGSHVLGKKELALRGKPACEIAFVYAGREPETLIWEEACPEITASMVDQAALERLGRWERLDDFARKFVAALPGGKVLQVEGSLSASVYPVGTTGSTYEVPVAD